MVNTVSLVLSLWISAYAIFVPFSLAMCRKFSVFGMRTGGYKQFSLLRYLWGFILHPLTVPRLCWMVVMATGYMTTRIAPNPSHGWVFEDNLCLAKTRAKQLAALGKRPINPTCFSHTIKTTWSPMEYMVLWTGAITLVGILGKEIYYFPDDICLGGSAGCRKEMEIAEYYRMTRIHAPNMISRQPTGGND